MHTRCYCCSTLFTTTIHTDTNANRHARAAYADADTITLSISIVIGLNYSATSGGVSSQRI